MDRHKLFSSGPIFEIAAESEQATTDSLVHSSFQPFVVPRTDETRITAMRTSNNSWLNRKLFHEHFLIIDSASFFLTIDPAFNFELGKDIATKLLQRDDRTLYKNSRGFKVQGNVNKQVGFRSTFYENQAVFPDYLQEYTSQKRVVPGQGKVKPFKEGFDYANASGEVFFVPGNHFQLMFGHGKQFIGEGHRSVFLSDNAFNYPYLRTDLTFFEQRMRYTFLVASFQTLDRLPVTVDTESPFLRMAGNFHYLSWMTTKWLRLGVFEGTVFQTMDSLGKKNFNGHFINPVLGVNALTFGLDHAHATIVGVDLKGKLAPSLAKYGQVAWTVTS